MAPTKYKVKDDECIEFKRKALARRAIAAALKEGMMKRPSCCDLCTLAHNKLEAHHVDYGSPLQVYWLPQPGLPGASPPTSTRPHP